MQFVPIEISVGLHKCAQVVFEETTLKFRGYLYSFGGLLNGSVNVAGMLIHMLCCYFLQPLSVLF
jgi:hypothetical protein